MQSQHKWAVIGAGVAGISAIGALLDHGVPAKDIAWIDPYFNAGDLGTNWAHVSSNTTVNDFNNALSECAAFDYAEHKQKFKLDTLEADKTCLLENVVEPLLWLTKNLKAKVNCYKNTVVELTENNGWELNFGNNSIYAEKIILTTGSEEKTLSVHSAEQTLISLKDALDTKFWAKKTDKPIAVFGSSHSAMIIIKNILEQGGKVINFYRSPLRFAKKFADWTLYDNTGLKGATAKWVQTELTKYSDKIERYYSSTDNISLHLQQCDLISYAVGFKPRFIPINGHLFTEYDQYHGIVANNLYATGIAFPRRVIYPTGYSELNVGFLKFVRDLKVLLPIWLHDASTTQQ